MRLARVPILQIDQTRGPPKEREEANPNSKRYRSRHYLAQRTLDYPLSDSERNNRRRQQNRRADNPVEDRESVSCAQDSKTHYLTQLEHSGDPKYITQLAYLSM